MRPNDKRYSKLFAQFRVLMFSGLSGAGRGGRPSGRSNVRCYGSNGSPDQHSSRCHSVPLLSRLSGLTGPDFIQYYELVSPYQGFNGYILSDISFPTPSDSRMTFAFWDTIFFFNITSISITNQIWLLNDQ